jgi:hypothetical protein
MLKHFAVVVAFSVAVLGQGELSSVKAKYVVGQTLHYSVSFDGDPNFKSVTLYFDTHDSRADQAGMGQQFGIAETHKVGPGKFDIEGKIPDNIVTGTYDLEDVQPRIEPAGVKDYDAKHFHIVLEIENPAKYSFPPLKDVSPK